MRLTFGDKAKLGYAILVLLLAGGLALSIRRLTAVANEQIAHVRAQEHEITLVERLRWNAELMARFYRTLLQEQRRVGPALSDAMRVAITGRFKDPGLWAAYALTVGDLDGI